MTIRQYPIPFKTRTNPNTFPELQKPLEDLAAFAKDTQGDIVTINQNITNIEGGDALRFVVTPEFVTVAGLSYTLDTDENVVLLASSHASVTIALHSANTADADPASINKKCVIIKNDSSVTRELTIAADTVAGDKIDQQDSVTIDEFPVGGSVWLWTDGVNDWRIGGAYNPENWPVDTGTTTGPWVIPAPNRMTVSTSGAHSIGTDIYHVYVTYDGASDIDLELHSAGDVDGKVLSVYRMGHGSGGSVYIVCDGFGTGTFDTINQVEVDKKYLMPTGSDSSTISLLAVSSNKWLQLCSSVNSIAGWLT